MNDLETRIMAAREAFPDAPAVPEQARAAMRTALESRTPSRRWVRMAPRGRRGRIGGALALAAALTVAGLAAAGAPPFGIADSANEAVQTEGGVKTDLVRGGTQQIVVAPGRGLFGGQICVTLANAQGATDVSPVLCQPPDRADAPGFDYSERRAGRGSWAVHVRVPDTADLASAVVSEYEIPARGGVVVFDSGDRRVTRVHPDLTAADQRADQDLREYLRAGLDRVRSRLARPDAGRAFEPLPAAQREALRLRVIDELDYPEIARRMGASVEVTRDRVSQALRSVGIEMNGMLP